MAHYAEISPDGIVQRVVVFHAQDSCGNTVEGAAGEAACAELLGGSWRQTSYNGTMRGRFAVVGFRYDPDRDQFIAPQPFASWTLTDEGEWVPPVPRPEGPAFWNEDTLQWEAR